MARVLVLLLVACGAKPTTAPAGPEPCTPAVVDVIEILTCDRRCSEGSPVACAVAAEKYCTGNGVAESSQTCLARATSACDLKSARGCQLAGSFYSREASRDEEKAEAFERRALPLYERECTANQAESCLDLAWWYTGSFGAAPWLKRDPAKAADYAKRGRMLQQQACERGVAYDCANLAMEHATNLVEQDGIAEDKDRAYQLRVKACELGHATSCHDVASNSRHDSAMRDQLLKRACALKLAKSCKLLDDFAKIGP